MVLSLNYYHQPLATSQAIKYMNKYEKVKLIVELTMKKLEILKLKADDYNWSFVSAENEKLLLDTLKEIDELLTGLKNNK